MAQCKYCYDIPGNIFVLQGGSYVCRCREQVRETFIVRYRYKYAYWHYYDVLNEVYCPNCGTKITRTYIACGAKYDLVSWEEYQLKQERSKEEQGILVEDWPVNVTK